MPESAPSFGRAFARASRLSLGAPRFDLRVDAQGARLSLARALTTSYGRLERCELALGRLPSPLDLRLGAFGLRGRRRRLRAVRLWLRASALERWAEERGVSLHVDHAQPDGLHLTLVDAQGALGFLLSVCGEGSDLRFGFDALRTRSGGEAPDTRLRRAAHRLGLDENLCLSRPLFWLLAEALCEAGQRAPEADALPTLSVEPGEAGFWLSAGPEVAGGTLPEPEFGAIWPGGEGDEELSESPSWWRREREFQLALARPDALGIASLVDTMLEQDPSPRLAAEAAYLASPLCAPPVAARLLARAAGLASDDAAVLARAAEEAPRAGRGAVLQVAAAIEASPCSDTLRGELMAMALRREAGAEAASDEALAAAIERALELAPHAPDVRLLAGEAHLACGEAAHALDHFRRAARGFAAAGRPMDSATASLAVARALDALGRAGAAERILVDARAETSDAPVVLSALARRWADAGLLADAHRAYAALLRQPAGRPGLEDALEDGVRFALAETNVAAATALVARLLRERPQHEAGLTLRDELRRLEAGVSHVKGPWDPDDQGSA